jgi:hypothetical protein
MLAALKLGKPDNADAGRRGQLQKRVSEQRGSGAIGGDTAIGQRQDEQDEKGRSPLPSRSPSGFPLNTPASISQGIPKIAPKSVPKSIPKNVLNSVPKNVPKIIPQELPRLPLGVHDGHRERGHKSTLQS